ncbi:PREDICTED: transmembrane protein 54-like, partial [Nestor notabilis]|uniref:transmembrane protein 54-like n=1 Tax=Nestor notabilis TaxID=176057 RepID=UPI000523BDC7
SLLPALTVTIALTLSSRGRVLLAPCTDTDVAFAPVSRECPFDPTRVHSSVLSPGATSLLFDSMEVVFSTRCLLLTLHLLCLGRDAPEGGDSWSWARGSGVGLSLILIAAGLRAGSPDPGQGLGLLRL